MHPSDKICHLCEERKDIFSFQHVYFQEVKSSIYICHACTIKMQKQAVYTKGLDCLNPLSTPKGEWPC